MLLAISIVVAAGVVNDYGVGWDEHVSYSTGLVNYRYVFEKDDLLLTHLKRDYGPAFELPAVVLQKALGIENLRGVYLLRRILTHALFLCACACIFLLTDLIYKNRLLASLAFAILWIHPQIFTHCFFNSKDIPFLSFMAISMYFLFRYFFSGRLRWVVLAGLFTGLLTATRIPGIIYFGLSIVSIFLYWGQDTPARKSFPALLAFAVSFCGSLYVSWPYLCTAPLDHFAEAFRNMSSFRWEDDLLYRGQYVPSTSLPWHYIPHWFSITTPPAIVLAGIAGIVIFCVDLLMQPGKRAIRKIVPNVYFSVSFLFPLLAVIAMSSVLYDTWKHMYFIYVPFVMLCVYAIHRCAARSYT